MKHQLKIFPDMQTWEEQEAERLKGKKIVNYDFTIDSLVSVEAPKGTDPDTLIELAMIKLAERVKEGDITLMFDTCFDSETGAYYEDWENGK